MDRMITEFTDYEEARKNRERIEKLREKDNSIRNPRYAILDNMDMLTTKKVKPSLSRNKRNRWTI